MITGGLNARGSVLTGGLNPWSTVSVTDTEAGIFGTVPILSTVLAEASVASRRSALAWVQSQASSEADIVRITELRAYVTGARAYTVKVFSSTDESVEFWIEIEDE